MDNRQDNKAFAMIADLDGDIADLRPTDLPETLDILPVRNIVVFPGVVTPILVGRASSLALVKKAEKTGRVISVFTQRDPEVDEPCVTYLYDVGVLAKVVKTISLPGGNLTARVARRIFLDFVFQSFQYLLSRKWRMSVRAAIVLQPALMNVAKQVFPQPLQSYANLACLPLCL